MSRGAAPGRADLLRALALRGPDAMDETAELLGFRRRESRRRSTPQVSGENPGERGPEPSKEKNSIVTAPRNEEPPMPITFWRPVARSYRRTDDQQDGQVDSTPHDEPPLEDRLEPPLDGPIPVEAPIVGWPRLWRALDESLRTRVPHHGVDIDRFVERTSRGEVLVELPRRSSRELGPTVLVIDRSPRLAPFWRDRASLRSALKKKLGPTSITAVSVETPEEIPNDLGPDQRWMVVGDLGLYGDVQTRRSWASWAIRTRRRTGREPLALIPCPRRGWRGTSLRDWQTLDWSAPNRSAGRMSGAKGDRRPEKDHALETLLCLASVAMRLETGLLRDLRRLVPEANLDTEVEIRRHPAVQSSGHLGVSLAPSAVRPLRRRFLELPETLKRSAVETLRVWHEGTLPEVWMAEMMGLLGEGLPPEFFDEDSMSRSVKLLTGINTLVARPATTGNPIEIDTDSFLWRLGQWGSGSLWAHPECRTSFERGFRALKARYPDSAYPVGVTPDMMVDQGPDRPIRKVKIRQVGDGLRAREPDTGSLWCEISFREPEILVSFGASRPRVWNPETNKIVLPESREACSLVTDLE